MAEQHPLQHSNTRTRLKIQSAVNRAHTRERDREHSARAALLRGQKATTGKQATSSSGASPTRGARRESLVRVDSKRGKKPRERWLLTRKTWRYMADAGRRLIPDGAHNRAEDVPRIEAYFQEVCHREPRFLLWRKSSYPGALGFRPRGRSRAGRKKGGSCRDPRDKSARGGGTVFLQPVLGPDGSGRFDVQRAKKEFLEAGPATTRLDTGDAAWDASWAQRTARDSSTSEDSLDPEDKLLLDTLEMYLARDEAARRGDGPPPTPPPGAVLDEQELLDKLRLRLESVLGRDHADAAAYPDEDAVPHSRNSRRSEGVPGVPFNGDHVQKQLLETLRRYYGKSTARQKVISDLLTERKLLERLLFDTRRARGFAYRRGGGSGAAGTTQPYVSSMSRTDPRWRQQAARPRGAGANRRRSSVDNDDVSPSVSDTIKRYLRMARKKSMDGDKADRFKRVNYDRNLRNIKAKGEITLPGDDDGLNKGAQTDESWVNAVKELKYEGTGVGSNPDTDEFATTSSRLTSSRSSFDTTTTAGDELASPSQASPATTSASSTPLQSPKSIFSSGQSFLSHLLHGLHQQQQLQQQQQMQQQQQQQQHPAYGRQGSTSPKEGSAQQGVAVSAGAMQKSKSSSSVVQSLEKIWKTRSKSHSRASGSASGVGQGASHDTGPPPSCSWTPQGNCTWSSGSRRVQLAESTPLLQLSEVERQVLQKVALAKLQALNLGVAIRVPSEKVVAEVAAKPKRRAYLLKRKALTTGVVDGRKDSDKDNPASGLVFGLPLSQCIENERGVRVPSNTALQARQGTGGSGPGGASRSSAGAADDTGSSGSVELRRKSHHGSRASFSSLVEAPRHDDAGSVEDLLVGGIPSAGSVPGQLNSLSSAPSSTATDFLDDELSELLAESSRIPWVPHLVSTCLRHLTNHGLHTLGIFRVSSSKKRVRQLREEFDGGQEASLDDDLCPHDVATLLKEYFRDLPDPLLCRDLYQAFVQTQRIRNRPGSQGRRRSRGPGKTGQVALAPKGQQNQQMPPIHYFFPLGGKLCGSKPKFVVKSSRYRTWSENRCGQSQNLSAQVSAELLDEVYMHMMDSHPLALDQLLRRRAAESGEDVDVEAEDNLVERSERRMWSREEFLHERCATPADEEPVSRGSRRSGGGRRRSRADSAGDSADSGTASGSGQGVITASLKIPVPGVAATGGVGGAGAAFALSVDDSDIPYIEDTVQDGAGSGRHQVTVGLVRGSLTGSALVGATPSSQSQRRRQRSGSGSVGSDSSTTGTGAAVSQGTRDSAVGSYSSPPRNSSSSPPSWASSPPLSPDPLVRSVNYIPDVVPQDAGLAGRRAAYSRTASTTSEQHVQTTTLTPGVVVQRVTFTSIGDAKEAGAALAADAAGQAPLAGIGGRREPAPAAPAASKPSAYQRILSSLTGSSHSSSHASAASAATGSELAKSATTSFIGSAAFEDRDVRDRDYREQRDFRDDVVTATTVRERDRIITPSISSIGGAVLRSKTADIERMLRISRTTTTTSPSPSSAGAPDDKKKYTKRRYTRHIPEADALVTSVDGMSAMSRSPSGVGLVGGPLPQVGVGAAAAVLAAGPRGSTTQGPVWKRRELIASNPKRHD
ncbi:uncharacterized protein LOC117643033 [Thrips palmi]|uniref:Uncharacterized protein LOC117643033 n=1 Tax=Thrips palmi TaxID=161013 RepID=A0A6P8YU02_THRPL|nr:uncharacterized protein LOC117643033 [Thrips palmi]